MKRTSPYTKAQTIGPFPSHEAMAVVARARPGTSLAIFQLTISNRVSTITRPRSAVWRSCLWLQLRPDSGTFFGTNLRPSSSAFKLCLTWKESAFCLLQVIANSSQTRFGFHCAIPNVRSVGSASSACHRRVATLFIRGFQDRRFHKSWHKRRADLWAQCSANE